MKRPLLGTLLGVLALSAAACVWISHRVDVQQVDIRSTITVTSPVKAHLKDGSTVVYRQGVRVTGDSLLGAGIRYNLTLTESTSVDSVPLDSVLGLETFSTRVNTAETWIVSTLATAGAIIGSAALLVAIFGSCPTVYSGGGAVEEAELFSSSIAPLFEGRDLDRLRAQPEPDGTLRVEVRNEAMETHYINHLQILEVQHASDEFVLPDERGRPVAVRDVRPPDRIFSRSGEDLRATLIPGDGESYRTNSRIIAGVSRADMDDWIDLTARVPAGADKIALVLRLRNSLLSTTLLYNVMLRPAGAAALDWLGVNLAQISTAVELGRWYHRRAGLYVSVWREGSYREVVRVPDSGPIFWHDVAAVIPVHPGQTSLRLRLSFLADHWRIDRISIASAVRDTAPRVIEIMEVINSEGKPEAEARESLLASDDLYLQTNPGQRFYAHFNVRGGSVGESRTFLLSSQGYYTEWIRGEWIRNASATELFAPTDETLLEALHQWGAIRESFEERFFNDRVPVR